MGTSKKRDKSLTQIYLELAKPDPDGYSRAVTIDELFAIDPGFRTGNGCSFARSDGALGKKYHIVREKDSKTGEVISVRLDGINFNPREKGIRSDILATIKARRCAVLDIGSNIECDHKNGKYDNRAVGSTESQRLDDFQPLSKAVNDAKRQHCKTCLKSGQRFDARVLGYCVGYTKGDAHSKTCPGCYWYDPAEFNCAVSALYVTDK